MPKPGPTSTGFFLALAYSPDDMNIVITAERTSLARPWPRVAILPFMPIFSGLRKVPLAAVDILLVWATILCCVFAVWPHYKWVGAARCRTSCGRRVPR